MTDLENASALGNGLGSVGGYGAPTSGYGTNVSDMNQAYLSALYSNPNLLAQMKKSAYDI